MLQNINFLDELFSYKQINNVLHICMLGLHSGELRKARGVNVICLHFKIKDMSK